MAWSDAARAAAAEARRRKAGMTTMVMDARTGFSRRTNRKDLAAQIRAVRAQMRNVYVTKGKLRSLRADLANKRYAARKMK